MYIYETASSPESRAGRNSAVAATSCRSRGVAEKLAKERSRSEKRGAEGGRRRRWHRFTEFCTIYLRRKEDDDL